MVVVVARFMGGYWYLFTYFKSFQTFVVRYVV